MSSDVIASIIIVTTFAAFVYCIIGGCVAFILSFAGGFWGLARARSKGSFIRLRILVFLVWPVVVLMMLVSWIFFFGPRTVVRLFGDTSGWDDARQREAPKPNLTDRSTNVKIMSSRARSRKRKRTGVWKW